MPHASTTRARARRWRATQAFTLIELLVVIAIVAILVAILLPAIAKARLAGQLTVSLSNMKQQSTAIFTYASEHKDAFVNPFDPKAAPALGSVWYAAVPEEYLNDPSIPTWVFNDSGRYTEMFGAHWVSLLMRYFEKGGQDNMVQYCPLDKVIIDRQAASIARGLIPRDNVMRDSSYFYSPTIWFSPDRYTNSTPSYVNSGNSNLIRRHRVDEPLFASNKVMLWERFDFSKKSRTGPSGQVKEFANWNNPGATARFVTADGGHKTVKVSDLNALANSADAATKATFLPQGIWDVDTGILSKYSMDKDGLENGSSGTGVYPQFFWATRRGIKGRDIP